MYTTTLVTYVNETLAGENLSYAELQIHLDGVIDDINATLNSVFPAFSEFDATRYPNRYPNYDFFPDKYIRNVVVSGAAFKFYITDEEGSYAAPQYERRYQQALFEMKRDYLGSVPALYRADQQGYMKDYEAARGLWLRPGGSYEELTPIDVVNPDVRIYEGRPGAQGETGRQGRGIQNMWIAADRAIHVRYTDQTEEIIGFVTTLVQGPQGIQGIEGKQGIQGEQGVIGLSGRSLTSMRIDEVNQIWIKYDRDYGGVEADTEICVGHIVANDVIARQQIKDLIVYLDFLSDILSQMSLSLETKIDLSAISNLLTVDDIRAGENIELVKEGKTVTINAAGGTGLFHFSVDGEGNLILSYSGDTAPDIHIDAAGDLIWTY